MAFEKIFCEIVSTVSDLAFLIMYDYMTIFCIDTN